MRGRTPPPSRRLRGGPALPTSVGLLPAVLKRSRADWPVVLASWVLLACALSLLAAGALYTDAVTLAGLHRELESRPAVERAIVVRTKILADRWAAADAAVMPELARTIAPTGGSVARIIRSSPYADATADAASVTDLVQLASFEGIEDHAALVSGAWAVAGRSPVEATISEAAAAHLGVATGDTVSLVSRLDASRRVEVRIVGTWTPDPGDPWWLDEPLAVTGAESSGSFTTRGPLVVAPDELLTGPLMEPLDATWRAIPLVAGFTNDNLDEMAALAASADGRINAALPFSNQAQVSTKLPAILATVDRSVLVAQAGIVLLLVQFGVLAAYAVILVAALLLERRRSETALLRSRGAGFPHLVSMAFGEALLVTIPAALAAPWLAVILVQAVRLNPALEGVGLETPLPGPATWAAALAGGLIALIALTLPTVASSVSIAGVRAAVGRQVGRTLPQRLGLDLVLVGLAVLAMVQLRLYGAPITRNARGALGVDPLLVAAPAIGLIGGAVLAIRIVPRLAELAERVFARGRSLVPALAGRQLSRRPLRYTRAALLLILASALGTFASAHAATWTRSQADQAAFAAGADVRLAPGPRSEVPAWGLGGALRATDGVMAATPLVRSSIQLGTTLRDGALLAVDGAALADLVRLRDDDEGAATRAALRAVGERRPQAPGIALPAGTRRVSFVVDSAFTPVDGFGAIPEGYEGLAASLLVIDGDGRLALVPGGTGPLGVTGARIEIPLTGPGGAALPEPVTIAALAMTITVSGVDNGLAKGTVDLRAVEASPDATGDAWAPVPVEGGRSTLESAGGQDIVSKDEAGPALPERIDVDSLFTTGRLEWRRTFAGSDPAAAAPVPIAVNPAFLERSGAAVGDTLSASVYGVPVKVEIVAEVPTFPTLDAAKPFAIGDGLALDLVRIPARVAPATTDEWWVATGDGRAATVAGAVAATPIAAIDVIDRTAVEADLAEDPLGLAVIGILGLGSLAALVFAAIGFLVSVSVSTTERIGELALLKALGLSPRQLLAWLSVEGVALLVVGLTAGVGLGLVLAWLALPFATLTSSGEAPVPAPEVVVPLEALVPTLALGLVLVVATVILVGRQLPAARTSAVLRARDE